MPAEKSISNRAVSLPPVLFNRIKEASEISGKTMAKQLEHYIRIAENIEKILPVKQVTDLKSSSFDSVEVLTCLVALLQKGNVSNETKTEEGENHE